MKFGKIELVKFVASGIVGMGTGKIVGKIIKNNVTPETMLEKITVTAAAWVIAGMATKATKKVADEMVDEVAKTVDDAIHIIKTEYKLDRINAGKSTFEAEGLDVDNFTQTPKGKWTRKHEKDVVDGEIVVVEA